MSLHHTNEDVSKQVDSIFALEGFQPTDTMQRIRAAIADGRVSREQVTAEMLEYVQQYKVMTGFAESRTWI